MNHNIFNAIEAHFMNYRNEPRALRMQQYLKNKFTCIGITSPERKEILKELFQQKKWTKEEAMEFILLSWKSKYRELQYAGLDIISKNKKNLEEGDVIEFERLVVTKSWWDTVDGLASNPIGSILHKDKNLQWDYVRKWSNSDNIWLKRTAIIHQLKYKDSIDTAIMEYSISKANHTKDFFLNKAIGWMLREYAKIHPEYVIRYCEDNVLSNLSKREALKNIK